MIVIKDNLLNTQLQFIAHQVNCQGVMGAGVAKALRNKYPELYSQYQEDIRLNGKEDLLGTSTWFKAQDGKTIINLFGQLYYGRSGIYTNYNALKTAIIEAVKAIQNDMMKEDGLQLCIAIPYGMGCGLAGGDWNKVTEILEGIEKSYNVLFFAYKLED